VAAMRKAPATRFCTFLRPLPMIFPPVISLAGVRPSHEAKWLSDVGHAAHRHSENAGHLPRGSPQQDRSVALERRPESERAGAEGEAEGVARRITTNPGGLFPNGRPQGMAPA
jgi:hypothetical protein